MNVTRATRAEPAATATTTAQSQPQQRRPPIKVRRYGRNDFERFDEEVARGSHLCVGSASIGKVDIDCKYHWRKAQWGVLGREQTPAGIVYMDITFKQPHGYWLERATVYITLSEDMSSYALGAPRRDRTKSRRSLESDYAVQITEHYGPRYLTGTKTVHTETKEDAFVPTVGVMGFEFGGIGTTFSTSKERVGRWVFKGTVCRPQGRDGLRTLVWELSENSLNLEQVHNQTYQTAFAFEHSRRPVFMRVEIEGKLRDRSRQMKHGLLRFSSTFGKKDYSTLTELDLSRQVEFNKSLDQIAQGLDMSMQMENCGNVPVEVPDPMPTHFMRETGAHGLPDQTQSSSLQHGPTSEQGAPMNVQEGRNGLELRRHECRYIQDGAEDMILESLRRQLQNRARSDVTAHVQVGEEARREGSETPDDEGTTAVNSEQSLPVKQEVPSQEAIDQALLEIVRIPALLVLLRFIATVLQRFSKPQQVTLDSSKEAVPKPQGQELVDDSRRLEGGLTGLTDRPWERERATASKPSHVPIPGL
ncbi:hypothetical protein VTI28DRAFT_4530 [Corynascus sepedonium]